jgi:hypothetical protein
LQLEINWTCFFSSCQILIGLFITTIFIWFGFWALRSCNQLSC